LVAQIARQKLQHRPLLWAKLAAMWISRHP
jgi:hypothetical protein